MTPVVLPPMVPVPNVELPVEGQHVPLLLPWEPPVPLAIDPLLLVESLELGPPGPQAIVAIAAKANAAFSLCGIERWQNGQYRSSERMCRVQWGHSRNRGMAREPRRAL